MIQQFILNLLVEAAKNPEIRAFVADQIARLADKLKTDLLPEIIGTFPTFGASLLKTVFDNLPNVAALPETVAEIATETVKHIADSDPDIPGLSNIIDLSELAKKWLGI